MSESIFVFGLGNPGRKFVGTRHNAGFEVVDRLAGQLNIRITESKFYALAGESFVEGRKVMLVKPTTFMNRSGECIRDILAYFKVPQEDWASRVVVVYDDVALPVGKIRIRRRGSAGGHNGIKNILYHLETEDFLRVRLGVGAKPARMVLNDYVLGGFAKDELEDITFGIIDAADAVLDIITKGANFAMNKHNPVKTSDTTDSGEDGIEA
ncbi:MAG: aminoacyl-tRNA hydrolase [Defluviitaleaceae bacterium]|nr:aminoacyl-tRNA hydrolase [Defluviitaleaceae bacterium]